MIRREVSKIAMGHAADPIHDHYRGLDRFAFPDEYEKFESGIDDALLPQKDPRTQPVYWGLTGDTVFLSRKLLRINSLRNGGGGNRNSFTIHFSPGN